jgi:two-component system, OmpR family, response regulator
VADVAVVRWPEEKGEVERLARLHLPRLLLIAESADPPEGSDVLQDWVRLPGDERDVLARLTALRGRATTMSHPPSVDDHGRLHFRSAWAQLSPINGRLGRALTDAFNSVVAEDVLLARGWPSDHPSSNALRVHLHRLRRRVRPLGLEVLAVRGEGWVLQAVGGDQL